MNDNNRYIIVNGTRNNLSNVTYDGGTTGQSYGFGAGIEGIGHFNNPFAGRLYGLRMDTDACFVPCQRKSDGKVGFAQLTKNLSTQTWSLSRFVPSTYTNDFGAGPITDEYFDTSVDPNLGF